MPGTPAQPHPLATAFLATGLTHMATAGSSYGRPVGWSVGLLTWAALAGWHAYRKRRSPGRVLIVEDDHQTRKMLAKFFVHAKWRVDEAETAAQALAALGNGRDDYQWVILDLMLPDRSGVEVLKYARTLKLSPRVAVTTGKLKGSPEWIEVLGYGADLVLAKPIEVGQLMRIMEATI